MTVFGLGNYFDGLMGSAMSIATPSTSTSTKAKTRSPAKEADSILIRENEGLKAKLAALAAENEQLRSSASPETSSGYNRFSLSKIGPSAPSRKAAPVVPPRAPDARRKIGSKAGSSVEWARISELDAVLEGSDSDSDPDYAETDTNELDEALKDLSVDSDPPNHEGQSAAPTPETSFAAYWGSTNPDDLTGSIVRDSAYPAHGGGYADVYTGTLSKNGLTTKVAVKVIRAHTYTPTNQWKIDKRLRREIRVWSCLRHPNVVPLLGTTMSFGLYIAMVCPWMNEGNLNHFLNDNKSKLNLRRRLQILTDIVEGLSYLHAQPVVHGDLTTGNILMDDGKAHLSDFGLSNVMAEVRNNSLMSSTVGGAPRWAAPELYHFGTDFSAVPEVTKHCDIYSFGSVALQVISGRIPYEEIVSDIHVMMEIMKGKNPTRPAEPLLSDEFWNFIVLCWNRDPSIRPEIEELREMLQVLRYSCSEEALAANVVDADKPKEKEPSDDAEGVMEGVPWI